MTPIQSIKQELLIEIEKLPEHRLQEVLQFVYFLLYSQNQKAYKYQGYSEQQEKRDIFASSTDPLAEFIGTVSHGSLAQNLDTELYDQ